MVENNFEEESLLKYFEKEHHMFISNLTEIENIKNSVLKYIKKRKEMYFRVEMENKSSLPEEQKKKLMGEMFYEFAFSRLQHSYKTDSIISIFKWYKNIDPEVTHDSEEIEHIYAFCKFYFGR